MASGPGARKTLSGVATGVSAARRAKNGAHLDSYTAQSIPTLEFQVDAEGPHGFMTDLQSCAPNPIAVRNRTSNGFTRVVGTTGGIDWVTAGT